MQERHTIWSGCSFEAWNFVNSSHLSSNIPVLCSHSHTAFHVPKRRAYYVLFPPCCYWNLYFLYVIFVGQFFAVLTSLIYFACLYFMSLFHSFPFVSSLSFFPSCLLTCLSFVKAYFFYPSLCFFALNFLSVCFSLSLSLSVSVTYFMFPLSFTSVFPFYCGARSLSVGCRTPPSLVFFITATGRIYNWRCRNYVNLTLIWRNTLLENGSLQ